MEDELQNLYRGSGAAVRASFREDREGARRFYRPLVSFVRGVAPPVSGGGTRLLDVGCGSGWSTFQFAEDGYDASGIDLNPLAFEPPPLAGCTLSVGSAMEIPHPPESFDVVVCYQCLEHIPIPARALDEMVRVCRRGGTVAIVGPNLLSPTAGLAYAAKPSSWRSLGLRRQPGTPRHPYGNTIPEIFAISFRRSWELLLAIISREPFFRMRTPDTKPPFHGDNDACYLCNPTDLIHYFRNHKLSIVRRGKPGRPMLGYLFAGGTWVAARRDGVA